MTDQSNLWRQLPVASASSALLKACLAALRWFGGFVRRRGDRTGARPEPPPIRWQF